MITCVVSSSLADKRKPFELSVIAQRAFQLLHAHVFRQQQQGLACIVLHVVGEARCRPELAVRRLRDSTPEPLSNNFQEAVKLGHGDQEKKVKTQVRNGMSSACPASIHHSINQYTPLTCTR